MLTLCVHPPSIAGSVSASLELDLGSEFLRSAESKAAEVLEPAIQKLHLLSPWSVGVGTGRG